MIVQRAQRPSPGITAVVRGYRERIDQGDGAGVLLSLHGRPAQFLEIYLGTPYQASIDGGAFATVPDAVLVGASSRQSTRLWMKGPAATFHIGFQPTGFHRLFGLGMGQIVDQGVGTGDLGLKPLDDLVARVRKGADFDARVRIADDWIAHRLAWARPIEPVDRLARLIRRAGGAPGVAEMAARVGLSPRQLQRRFIEQVGLSPKLYARTVRFDAVLEARRNDPSLSWTDLAHRHGYFDQAHLLRDAHAFTGLPPSSLIPEGQPMSDPS